MRILLALILFLFGVNAAFAINDVVPALRTMSDRAPIRIANNTNADRFTHLKKGVFLYNIGTYGDFYKVDLGNGAPYFIEKQYVEEAGFVPLPRYVLKKYKIKDNSEFYTLKIKFSNEVPVYQTLETSEGLIFSLFNMEKSIKPKKSDIFKMGKIDKSTLAFAFLPKQPLLGYEVEKNGDNLTLKIRKMPEINKEQPLKGLKIVLDPGHGGSEPGACANGIIEKNLNFQITKKLEKELEGSGAKVYLTRDKDEYVDLYKRIDFAKDKDAIVLLSIHANSLANPKDYEKKHGVGVYFYNKQSKPLANVLQKSLLSATGFKDDGVNYASFALTRPTEMLSVLVETGYVIHPWEAKMLKDDEFQNKIAKGIASALEGYFKSL